MITTREKRMAEKFIDISGVPERFHESLIALIEVLREMAKEKGKGQAGTNKNVPEVINLEGLSKDQKEFIRILVEFFREGMKEKTEESQKPERIKFRTHHMGAIKGNLSRREIYEGYHDHLYPPIHGTKNDEEHEP